MLHYDPNGHPQLETLPFLAPQTPVAQRTSDHQRVEHDHANTGTTILAEKDVDKLQLTSVSPPRHSLNPARTGVSQPAEAVSPAEASQRPSSQTEAAGRGPSLPWPRHSAILKPARVSSNPKKAKTAGPKAKSRTLTGPSSKPLPTTRRVTRSMVAQGVAPAPSEMMSLVGRSRREPVKRKETSTASEEPPDEPSTPPPPKAPSEKASGKRKRQEPDGDNDEEPQESPGRSDKGGKRSRRPEPEDEDQQAQPERPGKATAAAPPPPPPPESTMTKPDSTSTPVLPIPGEPNKATSRSSRPKAADFLDTDDASEEGPSSAAATTTPPPTTTQQRRASVSQTTEREAVPAHPDTLPPITPPIPWEELYGIHGTATEAESGSAAGGPGSMQTATGPLRKALADSGPKVGTGGNGEIDKGKGDGKGVSASPMTGISRRDVLSPKLGRGAAAVSAEPKGSTRTDGYVIEASWGRGSEVYKE